MVLLELWDAFLKAEYAWVMIQEYEDVFEGVSFGVPWLLVVFTIIENVVSCFKWSLATWAWSGFIGEESFPIFANRSIIGDESGNPIAAWKVTRPGLEPRPFWNCTRCSTIELSGPPGYHNVTRFPILSDPCV